MRRTSSLVVFVLQLVRHALLLVHELKLVRIEVFVTNLTYGPGLFVPRKYDERGGATLRTLYGPYLRIRNEYLCQHVCMYSTFRHCLLNYARVSGRDRATNWFRRCPPFLFHYMCGRFILGVLVAEYTLSGVSSRTWDVASNKFWRVVSLLSLEWRQFEQPTRRVFFRMYFSAFQVFLSRYEVDLRIAYSS